MSTTDVKQTKWEELSISNDFLFGKVMQDAELCKELLQRILPELDMRNAISSLTLNDLPEPGTPSRKDD